MTREKWHLVFLLPALTTSLSCVYEQRAYYGENILFKGELRRGTPVVYNFLAARNIDKTPCPLILTIDGHSGRLKGMTRRDAAALGLAVEAGHGFGYEWMASTTWKGDGASHNDPGIQENTSVWLWARSESLHEVHAVSTQTCPPFLQIEMEGKGTIEFPVEHNALVRAFGVPSSVEKDLRQ